MATFQHVSSISVVLVALFSAPAFADSADVRFRIGDVSIGVDVGSPSPPVVEYIPVAVPGHVWYPGARTRVRPGYSHVAGHWEQRGGRWYQEHPRWIARTHRHRDYERRSRHGDDHDRGSLHRRDGRHD